jgi:phosphoglycolate phosphatase-like HAD superfamily hydrolase
VYEEVRQEVDYVDYPTTVARWSRQFGSDADDRELARLVSSIDFKAYLYPGVLPTLAYLATLGTTVILSDGDSVFQPRKIEDSGLEQAVGGRVLVYVHKEEELPEVFRRYPADHYVVIDDKPRILSVLERDCPTTFTTVLVLQGKYAVQGKYEPEPDYVVHHIADLKNFDRKQFLQGHRGATVESSADAASE